MTTNKRIIVMDNGSFYSRCGFAGMDCPSSIIRTIVGYKTEDSLNIDPEMQEDYYFEDDTRRYSPNLDRKYPVQKGIIEDWNAFEKLLKYILDKKLTVNPDEHSILITEPPLNPPANKEKITELMLETFNMAALCIENQSKLALYDSGRETGCVVDIGYDVTTIVPFHEGKPFTEGIEIVELAGCKITQYFQRLFRQSGYSINSNDEVNIMRNMKEKFAYITLDPEKELSRHLKGEINHFIYPLPHDMEIDLSPPVAFLSPEILFDPSIIHENFKPIDDLIVNSIFGVDDQIQKELFHNIILCGGTSLLPGLKERLTMEIQKHIPTSHSVEVIIPRGREYSSWRGGSKLVCSSPKKIEWIYRK